MSTSPTHVEPGPQSWLEGTRLERARREVGPLLSCLQIAGLLLQVLECWIRQEIANDAPWSPGQREAVREKRLEQWKQKQKEGEPSLSDDELLQRLTLKEGGRLWARQQWGHRLESLFLANKGDLDKASCLMLQVSNRNLATELYHRIKAGEASFEELASQFSEGPERRNGGRFPLQPIGKLPLGMNVILRDLKAGAVTTPQPLGERWALVQLDDLKPAVYGEEIQEQLLSRELDRWIQVVVPWLAGHLK